MSNQQRWLSLEGICTTLQITRDHAIWLAKQGYLVVIWGDKSKKIQTARFLDPTQEYADKLRLGEAMYGRLHPLPKDLSMVAVLTLREIAEIMNWTIRYTQKFVAAKKLKGTKVGQYILYSVADVRNVLWRRQGRKMAKQRAPFLIADLIKFFQRAQALANEEVPTDAQHAEDDLFERKLTRMEKLPTAEREAAMKDFYQKMELAKQLH